MAETSDLKVPVFAKRGNPAIGTGAAAVAAKAGAAAPAAHRGEAACTGIEKVLRRRASVRANERNSCLSVGIEWLSA